MKITHASSLATLPSSTTLLTVKYLNGHSGKCNEDGTVWFEGFPKDFLLLVGYMNFFNTLHTLSPPRGSADDVVYTQQELSGLASTAHNSMLKLVSLNNTQLAHICDTATGGQQVET
jgi:hypothetical protein